MINRDMTETEFDTPFGQFKLLRLPQRKRELLRAWDAADSLLLQSLSDENIPLHRALICNDSFGAVAVALHRSQPISWSDSWLAHQACRNNLQHNDVDEKAVEYLDSLSLPEKGVQLVIIKVPKTLALLEYQLLRIKPLLTPSSRVLVAGMVKNMPASVWTLLEKIIGPSTTGRAVKKSRLIQVTPDMNIKLPVNPYPVSWPLDDTDFTMINHANVFSRDKLDIGARFMLEHLPETEGEGQIIDLGCGNGLLGLMAASQNARASVHFVDESYMAIASARENMLQLDRDLQQFSFHCSDGLNDFATDSADLILCNPPFHQSHSIGDTVARGMFQQAAAVLRPDAELWVVGNHHLGYQKLLKNWFATVKLIASNRKFVILRARDPGK